MKAAYSSSLPVFSSFISFASSLSLYTQPCITVILFCVSVPVLSEQIVFAPPIVSHAERWRTRLLSFIIFFTEYASAIVTESGRPSGMASTRMATPVMNACTMNAQSSSSQAVPREKKVMRWSTIITTTVTAATVAPTTDSILARSASLICSGV